MSAVVPVPPAFVACPACGFALPLDALAGGSQTACPQCRAGLSGALFPAFWQPAPSAFSLAEHAGDGEAVCFFHPENRAALSCERCGRFICAVCEFNIGARRICPSCLSSGLAGEKLPELIPWRFIWSDAALFTGLMPLLLGIFMWPFIVVSGAAAIFLAIFGWKRPGSLPRGRRRGAAMVGIVGGAVQIAIWITVVILIFTSRTTR